MSQTPTLSRGDGARGAGVSRNQTWLADYQPPAGAADELIGLDGEPNPIWLRFLDRLAGVAPAELDRRFASAERHVRSTGASFRVYGEERPWPLSPLPLLLGEAEWRDIAAGIAQRASLLEAVLRDLYGAGMLVADGVVPAAIVAGSPEFLRSMHGVSPRGGRFLHLYAADLGRGPDGRWRVVEDRTQAPSGAGYALENRLVLSRAMPGFFADMNVERLAPFFDGLRAALSDAAERSDPRICLMTSGPYSDTYFEQAYLARYLGFLLVEGDDLMMRDGRLHVRTTAGLKRVDVVWRRVDGDFIDPLELNPASHLGVPGILEAIRNARLVMANAPGSGLVESHALRSFLPAAAEKLIGETLRLPGVAAPDARLSTTPVWEKGRLAPRPFLLRVYAVATASGWRIMPGGFCRIAAEPDAREIAMNRGALGADVWVLADKPVETASLLPANEDVRVRRIAGNLPSRAADNLFWLGRYLERAEATVRLVRSLFHPGDPAAASLGTATSVRGLLRDWGALPSLEARDPAAIAAEALFGVEPYGSALRLVRSARQAASALRERLSTDTWQLLTELEHLLDAGAAAEAEAEVSERSDRILQAMAALSGFSQENMNRVAGWRFLDMGRRIERAINTVRFARALADRGATPEDLRTLLELIDSQITYGARYILGVSLAPVRDMVLLDPFNPRSVAFQVATIEAHLSALPSLREDGVLEPQRRLAIALSAGIATAEADKLDARMLQGLERDLKAVADLIGARYFLGGPDAVRPEKLTGLA